MAWQLQEAKQRFSQLVRQALNEGPQVVTRHGKEVVVVLSADQFQRLTDGGTDLKKLLLSGPDLSVLELERDRDQSPRLHRRVTRLQILLDDDLDAELDRLAAETRLSKAALIEQFVRAAVRPLPPLSSDPIAQMAGVDDYDPVSIDSVVYR